MKYQLTNKSKGNFKDALKEMIHFLSEEKRVLWLSFFIMVLNAGITMFTPYLIGYTIDHYIETKEIDGLSLFSFFLLILYVFGAGTQYMQTQLMGKLGQRVLYRLRNAVFDKLQQLPVAFFNQNKSGDLIARINNDTDRVNQFFSQSLMRFLDSIFTMIGAAIFLLWLQPKLGGAALLPAIFIVLLIVLISPWVKQMNKKSLDTSGQLSAEIQENLNNFKTIIVFNRRDYFRKKFNQINQLNYRHAIKAGLSNSIFLPAFSFFSNVAQLIVLVFGIYLIAQGEFTIGLLISYLAYINNFYQPLRQLGNLWASLQTSLAAWDRIDAIFKMDAPLPPSDSVASDSETDSKTEIILEFKEVWFQYEEDGEWILKDWSFRLERGKTYAFIGPTGGGKSTTANLISRLYDPTKGIILLDGKDLKTYSSQALTERIGFILQEPFILSGTLKDNLLYGNEALKGISDEALTQKLSEAHLDQLLLRFNGGLSTSLAPHLDTISLGQKQLIAFIRAVLRQPELLILDEATANIDTVTEQLLSEIINQLPGSTTKVVIAHRLNTIEKADEIFFVNSGQVSPAGNLTNALQMLLTEKRVS